MRIDNFEAFDIYKLFPDIDNDRYYNYRPRKKTKLIKGAKYALKGMSCDGFEMPERVYQVVALVHDVNDVVLNSVVMRQLEGLADDIKYSLNKTECQTLHIKYEPGLQLFPMEMNWKRHTERISSGRTKFEKDDMSTYPVSRIDGNIRYIVIKLNDFNIEGREIVNINNDKRYSIENFLPSLKITSKDFITFASDPSKKTNIFYMKTESVPFRIFSGGYLDNVSDDGLYVELLTKKPTKNVYTLDGISGINPGSIRNKTINDIFEITLDEFRLNKKKTKKIDPTYIAEENFSHKFNMLSVKSLKDLDQMPGKRRFGDIYYVRDTDQLILRGNVYHMIKPVI